MNMIADKVRDYVRSRLIEAARSRGEKRIIIKAGDVNDGIGLKNRQPIVCSVLRGKKLMKECKMTLVAERRGVKVNQKNAKNIWYTYQLLYR